MMTGRRIVLLGVMLTSVFSGSARAERMSEDALYKAEVAVSGRADAQRFSGFQDGAREVLVKLTGQPDLAASEAASAIVEQADKLISEHSYEERASEGETDAAQEAAAASLLLQMQFDRQAFDRAVRDAGLAIWEGRRPTVAIWIGVREARSRYILSRDAEQGAKLREALREASRRRAIPIVLPEEDQDSVTFRNIQRRNWSVLRKASRQAGADAVIYGTFDLDGEDEWDGAWVMASERSYAKWTHEDLPHDQALRQVIDRVMMAHAQDAR